MKIEKWKAFLKKLLYPPVWLIFILAAASGAALVYIFVNGYEETPFAYAAYVVSAYMFTAFCLLCVKVIPEFYRCIRQKVYDNKYGNRYMTDAAFRTHISLYVSLGINLMYAAINLVSFFASRSVWFVILAAYYNILAVMRFLLLRYVNRIGIGKDQIGEWRRSRLCSYILLTLNLILPCTVLMILYRYGGFEYAGYMIYVMAVYAFYTTAVSVRNIFKYKKYNSPVMMVARGINLAAALVSMLSLETAMLTAYAEETTEQYRFIMITLTGLGISVLIIALSVIMIVRAGKGIKAEKFNKTETE